MVEGVEWGCHVGCGRDVFDGGGFVERLLWFVLLYKMDYRSLIDSGVASVDSLVDDPSSQ